MTHDKIAGEAALQIAMAVLAATLDCRDSDHRFGDALLGRLEAAADYQPPALVELLGVAARLTSRQTGCPLPPKFAGH